MTYSSSISAILAVFVLCSCSDPGGKGLPEDGAATTDSAKSAKDSPITVDQGSPELPKNDVAFAFAMRDRTLLLGIAKRQKAHGIPEVDFFWEIVLQLQDSRKIDWDALEDAERRVLGIGHNVADLQASEAKMVEYWGAAISGERFAYFKHFFWGLRAHRLGGSKYDSHFIASSAASCILGDYKDLRSDSFTSTVTNYFRDVDWK